MSAASGGRLLGAALFALLQMALAQAAEHQHDPAEPPRQQSATDAGPGEQDGGLPAPRTPIPPLTDADRAAARPPASGHPAHDNLVHGFMLADRLEAVDADEGTSLGWELDGWMGRDLNRLWVRSEGEHQQGALQAADVEALYGHSIATCWDVVIGVRQDFRPGRRQGFAALGIQGLAPQRFGIEATAYIGGNGQAAARLAVEYELLFTNRLMLQPVLEIELYGKNDASRGIGSGLATAEAGLRLRYEITRRFAPYLGVTSERGFGRTADLRRAGGEAVGDTRLVAGLRLWF